MNTTSYFAIVTALQPISHIGKTVSTGAVFNTESVLYDNKEVEVPYVTGNSMKGTLRRVGMEVMASLLGLDPDVGGKVSDELNNPLTKNRLTLLWNGGILTSDGGRSVNIDVAAKLAELVPWLAVCGGCVGNQMIHGRIAVHPLTMICKENKERLQLMESSIAGVTHNFLSDNSNGQIEIITDDEGLRPCRRHLQVQEFTHKDDMKDNTVTRFLPEPERMKLLAEQTSEQEERRELGYVDKDTGKHVQMRYSVQTVKAMSRFFWRIDTFDMTPLMEDAFKTSVAYFESRPYVGGHRRQGHGLVHIEWLGWNRVEPAQGIGSTELSFATGGLYANHLKTRQEEIIEVLEAIAA